MRALGIGLVFGGAAALAFDVAARGDWTGCVAFGLVLFGSCIAHWRPVQEIEVDDDRDHNVVVLAPTVASDPVIAHLRGQIEINRRAHKPVRDLQTAQTVRLHDLLRSRA